MEFQLLRGRPSEAMRLNTDCHLAYTTSTVGESIGAPMAFRSRIYATSNGSTIDAVGNGRYLVCNKAYCFVVEGLKMAHEAVRKQDASFA